MQKHKAWLNELKKKQEDLRDQELVEELQKEERKLQVRLGAVASPSWPLFTPIAGILLIFVDIYLFSLSVIAES